jgi:hypothetical protein
MPKENTPSVIVPLDKVEHGVISGGTINESLLMASLTNAMGTSRGLNALLTWERDVAKAADVSVCNLLRLVRSKGTSNLIDVDDEIDQLLSMIAQKATSTAYASINPRSAATEGLLPLLADELQHLEPNEVRDATWSAALQLAVNKGQSAPDLDRDAMLNNALLISNESATGADRGSVLKAWHDDPIFKSIFGIDRANVVSQLSIKGSPGVAIKYVQMEGLCDASQQKKGVVLFALAAEIDADIELLELGEGRGKRARSVEVSPVFLRENKRVKLVTNMRYFFTLPRVEATNHTADYRLREPLVNQWAFAWATYAIRPGIVSF